MDINLQAPVDFSFATRAHSQRPKTEHFGGGSVSVWVSKETEHTQKKKQKKTLSSFFSSLWSRESWMHAHMFVRLGGMCCSSLS